MKNIQIRLGEGGNHPFNLSPLDVLAWTPLFIRNYCFQERLGVRIDLNKPGDEAGSGDNKQLDEGEIVGDGVAGTSTAPRIKSEVTAKRSSRRDNEDNQDSSRDKSGEIHSRSSSSRSVSSTRRTRRPLARSADNRGRQIDLKDELEAVRSQRAALSAGRGRRSSDSSVDLKTLVDSRYLFQVVSP